MCVLGQAILCCYGLCEREHSFHPREACCEVVTDVVQAPSDDRHHLFVAPGPKGHTHEGHSLPCQFVQVDSVGLATEPAHLDNGTADRDHGQVCCERACTDIVHDHVDAPSRRRLERACNNV